MTAPNMFHRPPTPAAQHMAMPGLPQMASGVPPMMAAPSVSAGPPTHAMQHTAMPGLPQAVKEISYEGDHDEVDFVDLQHNTLKKALLSGWKEEWSYFRGKP